MRHVALFAIVFISVGGTASDALSYVSGGGGTGGCCGIPPELEEQGRFLEQSFSATADDVLRRQRWAGTLCENHPCGELTEAQAKLLLDDLTAQDHRTTDRWFALIGAVTGIVGVLFGFVALYQTAQANRFARNSDARAIKSELRLDTIEKQQS